MRMTAVVAALALAGALVPAAARADDPTDSTMREPAARSADHDAIARMNRDQLAYVQQRDAGYAEGWRTYHTAHVAAADPNGAYADARAQYAQQLAAWRAAVAACRAGDWSACQQ